MTEPNRIICETESFPFNIDRVWEEVEKHPYVIGDFTWTSYDHIGEAGIGITTYSEEEFKDNPLQGPPVPYPFRLSYCADFDLCGFDRAQLHFRKIVWGSDETYVHVHNPHNFDKKEYKGRWSWSEGYNAWSFAGCEGMKTNIDVYSAAEEVEIIINGMSLGRKPSGKEQRFSTRFEVVYDPGEMIAISYAGGKEVSRQELFTAGAPEDVILTVEKDNFVQQILLLKQKGVDVTGVTLWGFADSLSWMPAGHLHLYDRNLVPKYAYFGMIGMERYTGFDDDSEIRQTVGCQIQFVVSEDPQRYVYLQEDGTFLDTTTGAEIQGTYIFDGDYTYMFIPKVGGYINLHLAKDENSAERVEAAGARLQMVRAM